MKPSSLRRCILVLALLGCTGIATVASAADAIRGQSRYLPICSGCHGAQPDDRAINGANNPDVIASAINSVSGMGFLSSQLTRQDVEDIAAYIGTPALNQNVLTVGRLSVGEGLVSSLPRGIACGGTCAWSYEPGAVISLTTTAPRGSTFAGWSGACSGRGECLVTMTGAKTVFARFERNGPKLDFSDLWWGGERENGWGLSIIHRAGSGQQVHALAVYDEIGRPTWYVLAGGRWNDDFTTFQGSLYQPRGAALDRYDPSAFRVGEAVGEARILFVDDRNAELDVSIGGVNTFKRVTRQPLGSGNLLPLNVGDLWWGGAEQNGWGLSISQQGSTLFALWYTYDVDGRPTWYVLPGGMWDGTRYSGTLIGTASSAWVGRKYDPARLAFSPAGTLTLDFENAEKMRMIYGFDQGPFAGVRQTKSLVRQPF